MNLIRLENLIIAIILFSTTYLQAQENFRPGHIIELSGDTLFGEIDYRGDRLMSEVCTFKEVENQIMQYAPGEISAYRFDKSKYYVSKEVDSTNVFLEYLFKGQVDLYYMRDANGDHYYIEKEGLGLSELPYEEGMREIDNGYTTSLTKYKTTKHRAILTKYMQDAPKVKSSILALQRPEHRNLLRLVEKYHNAVSNEEPVNYEKNNPLLSGDFEILGGVLVFRNRNTGEAFYIYQAGLMAHFKLSRANENFYMRTGILGLTTELNDLSILPLRAPLQIEYLYPKGFFRPRIAAGFNIYRYNIAVSYMAGANIQVAESITLSINYDVDFNRNENIFIVPGSLVSQSLTAGFLIDF